MPRVHAQPSTLNSQLLPMTRLIPDWEIRVTNFGLGYILMCLVVAIAATNTGNNGLYLVLAAMLAAMVVSGMLSRRNVRGVACEIEPVGEVVATRPAWLKLKFENRLRAGKAQALFFLHESLPGPLWIDPLAPGEKREIIVEGTFPRRGVFREADAGLLSRFPLGLFRKYRKATLAKEIVVYPLPVSNPVPEIPPEDARGGRSHPRSRGGGSDIRTLREFSPGDDPRDLHWKQSARMRRWIVREREAERDRVLFLAIDNAHAVAGRRRVSRPLRRRRRPLRGTGPPAALAGRRGRLPRPGRQGGGARRTVPTRSDSRSPRAAGAGAARNRRRVPGDEERRPALVRFVTSAPVMPLGLSRAYLLALAPAAIVAPLPLVFTEGASRKAILAYVLGVAFLWWRARFGTPVRLSDAAQNVLGLAYIAWLAYSTATLRMGLLRSVAHLLLFTALAKLASLKRPSEARLALLVIFLLTLASASSSTHVSSFVYFLAMSWLGFRALSRVAVLADFDEAPPERVLTSVPTTGLSLVAIAGGAVAAVPLFFALPRLHGPFVTAPIRVDDAFTKALSADRVDLESFGAAKRSDRVVLRMASTPDITRDAPLRLREAVFTEYQEGSWLRNPRHERRRGAPALVYGTGETTDPRKVDWRVTADLYVYGQGFLFLPYGTDDRAHGAEPRGGGARRRDAGGLARRARPLRRRRAARAACAGPERARSLRRTFRSRSSSTPCASPPASTSRARSTSASRITSPAISSTRSTRPARTAIRSSISSCDPRPATASTSRRRRP